MDGQLIKDRAVVHVDEKVKTSRKSGRGHLGCLSGCRVDHLVDDEHPHWDYDSVEYGQDQWAGLHPKWMIAEEGKRQSPIDICCMTTVKPDKYLGALQARFNCAPATMENNGHTVQVNWEGGHLRLDNIDYEMVQFHFHSPSEHHIDGRRYPLEMHFVLKSRGDKLAVVGVLFREGPENKFLSQFFLDLPPPTSLNEKVDIGELSVEHLQLKNACYYRYTGSLTTPPFTEGVTWTIMEKVHQASPEQLQAFRAAIPTENARKIQDLDNRTVLHRKAMMPQLCGGLGACGLGS